VQSIAPVAAPIALAPIAVAIGVYALAVMSPGPSFLLVARTSLARSRRSGQVMALGIASGSCIYAAATLFGLTLVLAYLPALAAAVQLGGGLYLCWLGLRMLMSRGAELPLDGVAPPPAPLPGDLWRAYRQGVIANLANPKVVAFFIGLFATVITPGMPIWARIAVLAGITLIDAAWHLALATLFSASKAQGIYRRFGRWIDRLFGGLLIVVGARLILTARLAR
jgi:RhtB (resistance to homoserine/threonine) family protein